MAAADNVVDEGHQIDQERITAVEREMRARR
jgi:hypothetical protein